MTPGAGRTTFFLVIRVVPRVLRLSPAPAARLAAVLLAVAVACPWDAAVVRAAEKDPTDAKIRLMAEALRARDAGDLTGAQQALVQLIALAPNDEAARRLRSEIEAQAIAQQAALAQQAIARQAAEERAAVEAVRRTYSPPEPERPATLVAPVSRNTPPPSEPVATSPSGMIDVRLPEPDQPVTLPAPATAAAAGASAGRAAATPSPPGTSLTYPAREIPQAFAPASPATLATSPRAPAVLSGPLAQKLSEIVLPEVNFNRTSLDEAVAWLSRASAENDSSGTSPRGTNIVLLDPARRNPPVTLSLRAVTVKRVLDFMTESVGFGYEVQDDAIIVRPGIEQARIEEVRQVEIEARFVEVPAGTIADVGSTWEVLRRLAPAGSAAAGSGSFTSFVGDFDVTAVVRALTQKQGSELLAAPAATVLSGQPATMAVLQEVQFPANYKAPIPGVETKVAQSRFGATNITIQSAGPQDFASQRVGATLDVTASVGADDRSITLDLHPKLTALDRFERREGAITEVSGGAALKVRTDYYQPVFSVREISTRVKIPDGATLVLGGLQREKLADIERRLPLLGDIPGLGRLFRLKDETWQQRDLLIFITARVVPVAR